VLFKELEGAKRGNISKVVLGGVAIVIAAVMLASSTLHGDTAAASHAGTRILAAIGASFMWGTMYGSLPQGIYQRDESALVRYSLYCRRIRHGAGADTGVRCGLHSPSFDLFHHRGLVFWLFLGGFVWVIGDLFQQFAAKYLGNRTRHSTLEHESAMGVSVGSAGLRRAGWRGLEAPDAGHCWIHHHDFGSAGYRYSQWLSAREQTSNNEAVLRECERYGLDLQPHSGGAGRGRVRRSQRAAPLVGLCHRRRGDGSVPVART